MLVIALTSFTGVESMHKGEIKEIPDALATDLISNGLVKQYFEPDDVQVFQTLTEGTEIAEVQVNGVPKKLFAPAGGGGGGSSGLFPMTFTWSEGGDTASLNKTFAEIRAAVANGLYPVVLSYEVVEDEFYVSNYLFVGMEGDSTHGCTASLICYDSLSGEQEFYLCGGATENDYPTYNPNA